MASFHNLTTTIEWEKVGFVPSFSAVKRVYLAGKLGTIKKIAHTRFSSQPIRNVALRLKVLMTQSFSKCFCFARINLLAGGILWALWENSLASNVQFELMGESCFIAEIKLESTIIIRFAQLCRIKIQRDECVFCANFC